MINATNLDMTAVTWPGYPPLFELDTALDLNRRIQVMQVHFWSPQINSWVKLVPVKNGEQGVVEVTPVDIENINAAQSQGFPKVEAIRQVLGVTV